MVQPPFNLRRKGIPVHTDGLFITDVPQHFIRFRDDRRTFVRIYRGHFLNPVRNEICICHDDLISLFLTEIRKLLQHLLCRPQIERRLVVCILHLLARKNNSAVNFILRVKKMHVTGGGHRLSVALPQFHDTAVHLL